MNKNLKLGLLALVVVALGYWAYLTKQKTESKGNLNTKPFDFAVRDTSAITKIVLSEKSGRLNTLERKKGGVWMINNKYVISPSSIELILGTIKNVELKRRVTSVERESVIKNMATAHTLVKVFVGPTALRSYLVGSETDEHTGTYYLLEGEEEPCVVKLPGFEGILNVRFAFNDFEIRSRKLLASTPQSLQEAEVQYPSNPQENFKVIATKGYAKVEGISAPDTLLLTQFVRALEKQFVQQWVNRAPQKMIDSVRALTPYAVIKVKDQDPYYTHTIRLYKTPDELNYRMLAYIEKNNELAYIPTEQYKFILATRAQFTQKKKQVKPAV